MTELVESAEDGFGAFNFGRELWNDDITVADGFEVFAYTNDCPAGVFQGCGLPTIFLMAAGRLVKSVAVEFDNDVPRGHDHVAVKWPALLRIDDRPLDLDRYTGREEFVA
ncbi:hypothetical protein A5638_20435 [Mycolicibacterium fortuitum]|nr:hypothetical protein A5638_20435 [Mycolicibacterium fortuitum]